VAIVRWWVPSILIGIGRWVRISAILVRWPIMIVRVIAIGRAWVAVLIVIRRRMVLVLRVVLRVILVFLVFCRVRIFNYIIVYICLVPAIIS